MESIRERKVRWALGVGVAMLWAAACAQTQSGVGGESHFACKADPDCAGQPGNQVCFNSECTPLSEILDAARHAAGGSSGEGGRPPGGGAGVPPVVNFEDSGRGGPYCGAAQRATYPVPPTFVAPSTKNVEIVAAEYTLDLGDGTPNPSVPPLNYRSIGFDLDNTCTTSTNSKSGTCRVPQYANGVVDGPGGIDNSFGGIVQAVRNQITNFSSDSYTKTLQSGKANMLVRVQNWNGQPDDDQVTVSTMVTAPFDSFAAPGAVPKWDGTDAWPVAADAVNGSVDKPKFVDTHAYVTNNQVVATLSQSAIRLGVGLTSIQDVKLDLALRAAFVVCTIAPSTLGNWGYTLSECTLGGRWSANDLVKQLGAFPDPLNNNKPLCKGTSQYDTFKASICSQVDLNSNPTAGPTQPCDALSVGITFTTKPALLGNLYALKPNPDPCPPEPIYNPKYDCCESVGVADAGRFAACGFSGIDAGSPSGTGGTGGGVTDASGGG
jgi:hypothetical protein